MGSRLARQQAAEAAGGAGQQGAGSLTLLHVHAAAEVEVAAQRVAVAVLLGNPLPAGRSGDSGLVVRQAAPRRACWGEVALSAGCSTGAPHMHTSVAVPYACPALPSHPPLPFAPPPLRPAHLVHWAYGCWARPVSSRTPSSVLSMAM